MWHHRRMAKPRSHVCRVCWYHHQNTPQSTATKCDWGLEFGGKNQFSKSCRNLEVGEMKRFCEAFRNLSFLNLPPRPVLLWIKQGEKPKWLPLNFGYHDLMGMLSTLLDEFVSCCAFFLLPLLRFPVCSDSYDLRNYNSQ